MAVVTFPLGPLSTNSYIIDSGKKACAIDVGGDPGPMMAYILENNLQLEAICLTHMHFDHIYGVAALAEATRAPVLAPAGDAPIAATESSQGGVWGMPKVTPFHYDKLPLGKCQLAGMECTVIETPGHTPGGVSLYFPEQNCVFVGDALFYRSIGRTDFPMGNHGQLIASIREKLFKLPANTVVYPGHGPATTIGDEKQQNPFCGDFADE